MSWLKQARKRILYKIHLRWQGNNFVEHLETNSVVGARQAAKARFPGCLIRKIVRHKLSE